jgi:hypothetical protein
MFLSHSKDGFKKRGATKVPYGPVWTLFSDRRTNQQNFIPHLVVLPVFTSLVFRWIQEREATKRALGLPPYGPVWTLVRTDGKQGPISIGKTPLIIGSDVSHMEKVVPVQLDYPTVRMTFHKVIMLFWGTNLSLSVASYLG